VHRRRAERGGRQGGDRLDLGFDEAWSRFAPGICILFAEIEFAASRGYAEYDLGIEGHAYQYESPTVRSPSIWSGSSAVACGRCNRRSNSCPSNGVRR
jgi:hypothetical protein